MKGVEEISKELKRLLYDHEKGSRCVFCTAYGYDRLKDMGYDVKICFGFAAFSVNKQTHGIISFGDKSTNQYMAEVPNAVHGHYWLRVGNTIIDFSLLFLEETRDMLDAISGISTGPILLSKNPIVRQNKNKPLVKLQRFQIAHHYELHKIVSAERFIEKHGTKL